MGGIRSLQMRTGASSPVPSYLDPPPPPISEARRSGDSRSSGAAHSSERVNLPIKTTASGASSASTTSGSYDNSPAVSSSSPYPRQRSSDLTGASASALQRDEGGGTTTSGYGISRGAYGRDGPGKTTWECPAACTTHYYSLPHSTVFGFCMNSTFVITNKSSREILLSLSIKTPFHTCNLMLTCRALSIFAVNRSSDAQREAPIRRSYDGHADSPTTHNSISTRNFPLPSGGQYGAGAAVTTASSSSSSSQYNTANSGGGGSYLQQHLQQQSILSVPQV